MDISDPARELRRGGTANGISRDEGENLRVSILTISELRRHSSTSSKFVYIWLAHGPLLVDHTTLTIDWGRLGHKRSERLDLPPRVTYHGISTQYRVGISDDRAQEHRDLTLRRSFLGFFAPLPAGGRVCLSGCGISKSCGCCRRNARGIPRPVWIAQAPLDTDHHTGRAARHWPARDSYRRDGIVVHAVRPLRLKPLAVAGRPAR